MRAGFSIWSKTFGKSLSRFQSQHWGALRRTPLALGFFAQKPLDLFDGYRSNVKQCPTGCHQQWPNNDQYAPIHSQFPLVTKLLRGSQFLYFALKGQIFPVFLPGEGQPAIGQPAIGQPAIGQPAWVGVLPDT